MWKYQKSCIDKAIVSRYNNVCYLLFRKWYVCWWNALHPFLGKAPPTASVVNLFLYRGVHWDMVIKIE